MSKYSKSSKRSQSSAGNHFDKLIKVCSNSKVAGTLGRFGVASFTSIRSNVSNEVKEEEKKPKSKYSSFKKRARLEAAKKQEPPPPPPPPPPTSYNNHLSTSGGGVSSQSPTVFKPRKFFKSRGPMEVEAQSPASRPVRPEISSLMPSLPPPPIVPSMSPLIPSNTNSNLQYYTDQNQKQHKGKNKRSKKLENLQLSSPPPPPPPIGTSGGSSSDSSFTSPPIKLRIFKDRGKFVAEAPTTPTKTPPPPPLEPPSTGKKRGRKPGSKNKKSSADETEVEQKPPKSAKRAKQLNSAAPPPGAPPPPPPRPSGRTTRNSTRRGHQEPAQNSADEMPCLDMEFRNSTLDSMMGATSTSTATSASTSYGNDVLGGALGGYQHQQQPPPVELMVPQSTSELHHQHSHPHPPPAQEIIKKLEEDADFKKLSEMLSSMEETEDPGIPGAGTSTSSNQVPTTSSHSSYHHDHQGQSQGHQGHSSQNFQGYHHQQQQDAFPVNLSSPDQDHGNNFQTQQYMHQHQQPFRDDMEQDQTFLEHHQQNFYSNAGAPMDTSASGSTSTSSSLQHQHHQLPQHQNLPKANDIRSILVDDWDDFDDEHSPQGGVSSRGDLRASGSRPSSQASHHSQSPPKFSRFDMSAFMPSGGGSGGGSGKLQHLHQQGSPQPQFPPPVPEVDHLEPQQFHNQQMPFNIHSSPYAMRNLLQGQQGQDFPLQQGQGQPQGQDPGGHGAGGFQPSGSCALESLQQHHHTAPLNSLSSCAKQEAISVLDSVLKQQEVPTDLPKLNQFKQEVQGQSSLVIQQQQQQAPSTRKASIFKSRGRDQNQNGEGAAGSGSSGAGGSQFGVKGQSHKRLALYRHKFGGGQQEDDLLAQQQKILSQSASNVLNDFEEDEDDDEDEFGGGDISGGQRSNVRIKNVKAVHQLQESGEFHEFDGDVQYILEDLRSKNPMNIRCLSAVTLATRCMEPAFRMHLRAHGTVQEFCRELHDSPHNSELALLAALVLFVLSQDRLNMDLDTDTLKLILALSKADNELDNAEGQQGQSHRQKVLDLCVEMKNRGHATHLKLDRITASELALETLLHLTSKRAGEWVKHELRSLGGLDSIVNEVDTSLRFAQVELQQLGWTEGALERLRKVDRCLQVLQQVTFNHEHNQRYLLGQSEREVAEGGGGGHGSHLKCVERSPQIFVDLFRFCKDNLLQFQNAQFQQLEPHQAPTVIREILFSVLRVLVNLSHDYRGIVLGSEILLAMDGFLGLCLHSTFEMGGCFPDEKIFDLLMHSLCMLLNLVEHSRACRNAILTSTVQKSSAGQYRVAESSGSLSLSSDDSGVIEEIPVLDAFVEMFLCRERAAKKEESNTDNILTKGPENDSGNKRDAGSGGGEGGGDDKNSQDSEGSSLQDTIDKLIQTAGKHMENSLIAAYISLLLAYLIMDNPTAASQVRNSMPNGQYLPLMIFLKKLFNFMSITSSASGSIRGLKATAIALRFFAKADPASDEQLKKLIPD